MWTRRQVLLATALGIPLRNAHAALANASRLPHHRPRAKQLLVLFQTGGVSHVDSFDPKPRLRTDDGKPAPYKTHKKLFGSPWEARPRGQSGLPVTDLFPAMAEVADELCVIRSLTTPHGDHFAATVHMHTGSNGSALPGLGAWVSHGLGPISRDLPAHVVFADKLPYAGAQSWSSNFLPAEHQGVRLVPKEEPLPNLDPGDVPAATQRAELDLIAALNRRHAVGRPDAANLNARTLSFERAWRMQETAPEVFRLDDEPDHVLDLYGVERGGKRDYGWQCLMARRLLERGVRFVEIFDRGASSNWDHHGDIKGHAKRARMIDVPIAGLLTDMRQRGLLDDVLVLWVSEFGRTPHKDGKYGRGHHRLAFSGWLAGAGVRRGHAHGETDEFGHRVVADKVTVHDLHATVLHLLGLDHERLTWRHGGRDFRLTDVHGHVVDGVLA